MPIHHVTAETDPPQETETVEVFINENAIRLPEGTHNAASILTAATDQGVKVEDDFIVRIEREDRNTVLVTDSIEIVAGTRITALAPDDNS